MNAGDFLRNAVLDHVLGGPDLVRPATLYIGLSSANPLSDGSGIAEPAAASYARASITNDGTFWEPASAGSKSNLLEVTFPVALELWGTMSHYFIISTASGAGDLYFYGELSTPRIINVPQEPRLQGGVLTVNAN